MPKSRVSCGDRLLEGGWLAVALCVPLAINPWGVNIFALPKAALFRTFVMALLAVWITDHLLDKRRPGRTVTGSPLTLPAVVLLLVLVAATAFAADPALSFWGSYGRAQGATTLACLPALALLMAVRLRSKAAAKRLFWVATATAGPLAGYAGLQLAGADPLGIVTDSRSPVMASLGRSNFVGAYMAMLLPLALSLWRITQRPVVKLLAATAGLLELAVLLSTQARAGLLAALAGTICWTALLHRARVAELARKTSVRVSFWSAAALASAGALWLAQTGGSGAARLAMWQGAQKLIAAHPFLGYGPDSLVLVFPRVYPPELVYHHGRGLSVDRAHNVILDWTATLGILGLFAGAAFLMAVLASARRSLALADGRRKRELLVIGALSSLVANLTNNLLTFDVVPTLALSWMLAGTVVALEWPETSAQATAKDGDPTGWRLGPLAPLAVAAAILGATVAIWAVNARPLIADTWARRANHLGGQEQWHEALAAAERAVSAFPPEPVYRLELGRLHFRVARLGGSETAEHLATAERVLEQTVALRPDDLVLAMSLAEFHGEAALRFDRRHLGKADEAWAKASALAPNHGIVYLAWGRMWLSAGDPQRATPLLRKAVDLDATDSEAWLLLADLELQGQRPTSALVMYRQATTHAPGRPEPIIGLARTYWVLGQPDAARRAVTAALELDPSNQLAMALEQEFADARLEESTPPS